MEMMELADREWRIFLKAHWRKGFWNKPWFWLHFQRWPGVGFALLVCGVELAILRLRSRAMKENGDHGN